MVEARKKKRKLANCPDQLTRNGIWRELVPEPDPASLVRAVWRSEGTAVCLRALLSPTAAAVGGGNDLGVGRVGQIKQTPPAHCRGWEAPTPTFACLVKNSCGHLLSPCCVLETRPRKATASWAASKEVWPAGSRRWFSTPFPCKTPPGVQRSPKEERCGIVGGGPEEAKKMLKGLENPPYGDRLRELGVSSLEKRMLKGNLTEAFQYLEGAHKKEGELDWSCHALYFKPKSQARSSHFWGLASPWD